MFTDETGAGSGPGIEGASVTLTGEVDATLVTAADGTFSVPVPERAEFLVHLEAVDHVGLLEAEVMEGEDRDTSYGLSPRASVDWIFGSVGLAHEPARGVVVVDFQTDSTAGGESATLDLPYEAVLTRDEAGAFVVGDTAPAGGDDTFITFVNVAVGTATITPVSPQGQACTMRGGLGAWPVLADTVTVARVDCGAP